MRGDQRFLLIEARAELTDKSFAMLHSFGRKTLPEFREAKVGAIDFKRGRWRSFL